MNVHIYLYDDLSMLQGAVASVPEGIPIHVCDGRYADFPGETDITPGAAEWCSDHPQVTYHAPPADRRPFPAGDTPKHRRAVHEKAAWVNYEVLPPDEWTLKLDSDERLPPDTDLSFISDLDPIYRYSLRYRLIEAAQRITATRIWQPQQWTVWVNDALLPRDAYPRDTPPADLPDGWHATRGERRRTLDDPVIENHEAARSDDYLARRVDHMESIGRPVAARRLRDRIESTE